MAVDSGKPVAAISVVPAPPGETTPLLPKEDDVAPQIFGKGVVWRILFTGFIVSLSFGVTQVPLVYVFQLMTCDEYYKTHPDPGLNDRCKHPIVEARSARAIALLGVSTTVFGVVNLFVTGWWIKRFGIKSSLLTTVFWPTVRLAIQNVGVEVGGEAGVAIIQLSQIITIVGGPAGYLLSLNSFVAEVVKPAERTGTLGRMVGCCMFGTSLGFLSGGLLADRFGIRTPFRVTVVMFSISWLYIRTALPYVRGNHLSPESAKKTQSISAFFEPLRMFVPRKWVLANGKVRKEYGVLFLGAGAFFGVLATGYIPLLLQLYSIDALDFGTAENGWLIALNCLVRGLFLTLVFPSIISRGRKWCDRRKGLQKDNETQGESTGRSEVPINAEDLVTGSAEDAQAPVEAVLPVEPAESAEPGEQGEPAEPNPDEEVSFEFDLIFTRWSIIIDAVLTGAATFVTKGWQVYLVAVILPLASGGGSAAKGTTLQMCPASQRTDALSAISLVEMVAKMSTIGFFGVLFSAFATIGKPNLTFTCNAAVALLGFCVLVFAKFPPPGSRRLDEEEDDI